MAESGRLTPGSKRPQEERVPKSSSGCHHRLHHHHHDRYYLQIFIIIIHEPPNCCVRSDSAVVFFGDEQIMNTSSSSSSSCLAPSFTRRDKKNAWAHAKGFSKRFGASANRQPLLRRLLSSSHSLPVSIVFAVAPAAGSHAPAVPRRQSAFPAATRNWRSAVISPFGRV